VLARLSAALGRVAAFFGSGRGVVLVVCIAVLPGLATLEASLVADDHLQYEMVRGGTRAPWNLFSFLTGNAAETSARIRHGELPWILSPDVKHVFFRPLASLTHWLDYRLWGDTPAIAHLQSVLWLGVLGASVAWTYRRLDGPTWAATAAVLAYLWSPAVAFSVGWLAGRNTLMATAFGTLALGAHHGFRATGSRRWQAVAVALVVLSLACSEAAAGGLALLLAYAAVYDTGPRTARATAVAPYVALALAWWSTELSLGFGVAGSDVYVDLRGSHFRVLRTAASHLPDLALLALGRAHLEVLHAFRLPPRSPGLLAFAGVLVLLVLSRALTDRASRFWSVGAVLATLPFCLIIPQPRLLAGADVGLAMAVARALALAIAEAPGSRLRRAARWLQTTALGVTLGAASLLGLVCMIVPSRHVRAALRVPPGLPEAEHAASRMLDDYPDTDVVVAVGDWLLPQTARLVQAERGVRPVRSVTTLAGTADVRVERPDRTTLVLLAPRGMLGETGRLLRSAPFHVGERVQTPRFTVEVLETSPDVGPTRLRYAFDGSLDDPSLAWLTDAGPLGLLPVAPPPIGYREKGPGR
jgi:hypothetical protein